MTITYDAAGLCTRCGSTGSYLGSYTSDSSFADERVCIKQCPCRRWRPSFCAPEGFIQITGHGDVFTGMARDMVGAGWYGEWLWQPLPQPPEES